MVEAGSEQRLGEARSRSSPDKVYFGCVEEKKSHQSRGREDEKKEKKKKFLPASERAVMDVSDGAGEPAGQEVTCAHEQREAPWSRARALQTDGLTG